MAAPLFILIRVSGRHADWRFVRGREGGDGFPGSFRALDLSQGTFGAAPLLLLSMIRASGPYEKESDHPEGLPDPSGAMTSRRRFMDACRCRPVDRPPIWMMRQAGRCLPEYRALKENYPFLELVRTPELATEVTLQPVRRFRFDAAILFSDILVVPEAMGQGYHFRDAGGIEMEFAIREAADIRRLSVDGIEERLHYVSDAIRLVKRELSQQTALLGFAGSPWTLANFMLEGGSTKTPARALELRRADEALFCRLMTKLTDAVIRFLRQQIAAGVDAVQIFDSHGGRLTAEEFDTGSGRWIREVIAGLESDIPVIIFSKGTRDFHSLLRSGANAISLDSGFDLGEASRIFPDDIAIQGNLDPQLLLALTPEELRVATHGLLRKMDRRPGYIFNLGHGVPPTAPLEGIASVVETVRNYHG